MRLLREDPVVNSEDVNCIKGSRNLEAVSSEWGNKGNYRSGRECRLEESFPKRSHFCLRHAGIEDCGISFGLEFC